MAYFSVKVYSQTKIEGTVKDKNGAPLIGANVYIKGSYDGATTDTSGKFRFSAYTSGTSLLVISYLGYDTYEGALNDLLKKKPITIILSESKNSVEAVVITAGSFEAGEKSRAVLLTPVEIATTASSDGDVYGALKSFPGVQKQGESGKIIVRGGDVSESKTYMDGLLVSSPYTSSMPDLPARGRFSPFMFNGVMFSTGGYSAEYGQALSSVLELKTPGLFDEGITSVSLLNVGVGLSHTQRFAKSAYNAEMNYNNLYPYFLMAKNDLNWIEVPENYGGNFYHRVKVGESGMIKTDITYTHSYSKLDYSNFGVDYDEVGLKTGNLFVKTNYNTKIGEKWLMKFGVAYNHNNDIKELDENELTDKLGTIYSRLGFVNYINDNVTLRFGVEAYTLDSKFNFYVDSSDVNYKLNANEVLSSGFVEGDIKISENTAIRIGGRAEHAIESKKSDIAPRISLAQKITDNSQLSMAYGEYYQQAEPDYLRYNDNLGFERATHFLVNYQVQKNKRSFRSEVYYKKYNNLITYQQESVGQYENIENKGYGHAKGIDVFWKDDKTFKSANYWISYSYIDSKRKFKDYKYSVTPDFVTVHNLSFVMKYWIRPLNTQACLTYNYTSGRPYNNPNDANYMSGHTRAFHDLSGNLSYITNIFGYFTVVHVSVSNIPGLENIYTYHYSLTSDENGVYHGYPVKSMIQRTIIIGVFISIK